MVVENLIFDLGMHRALDSEFYLRKGFDVIALEANPRLAQAGRDKLSEFIKKKRLQIVEKALWEPGRSSVKFYVNDVKDDWSSVLESWSRKGNHDVEEIEVSATTLEELIQIKGVPYYIKCDIEGADTEFMRQLQSIPEKPKYVSVEPNCADTVGWLASAGYKEFQLVNQALSGWVKCPSPPREGKYHEARFNGHMSGLFGRELDANKWLPADEATENLVMFRSLKKRDPLLAHGWLDVHARRP